MRNTQPSQQKPKVFFDGACPLCRREIAHYRRLKSATRLDWIDIQQAQERLAEYGIDHATAMARFHVLDTHKQWQTGAYGFVEMWSHLNGYRWIARLIRSLRLSPLLDALYRVFARWRLRQRCHDERCNTHTGTRS